MEENDFTHFSIQIMEAGCRKSNNNIGIGTPTTKPK
jgi:hypothetical protein